MGLWLEREACLGTSFISDQFINECFPIMMAFYFLYICEYGVSCNECLANEHLRNKK